MNDALPEGRTTCSTLAWAKMPKYYEFFAGGGMARLGLGKAWECLFANDISPKKGNAYRSNFPPAGELFVGDVNNVTTNMLPPGADLAWASFPCQDLSLAGNNGGIHAARSGAFWPFIRIVRDLRKQRRALPIVVLENVTGLITSKNGDDLRKVIQELNSLGYRVGPLVMDAVHFLPQSRPRLFIVAVHGSTTLPPDIVARKPGALWHPKSLIHVHDSSSARTKRMWLWWKVPIPGDRKSLLRDIVEDDPAGVKWHTQKETRRLLAMMSDLNKEKLREAARTGQLEVGTVYKRTRKDETGRRVQRAEVRFDGVSGCLRTPAGGSSRQLIVVVEGKKIRSRLLSPRETARLMGVPDTYVLPERYNDAYHVMGDGLAVPVVSWLERHVLRPVLSERSLRGVA